MQFGLFLRSSIFMALYTMLPLSCSSLCTEGTCAIDDSSASVSNIQLVNVSGNDQQTTTTTTMSVEAMYQMVFARLNTDSNTHLDNNELSAFFIKLDTDRDDRVSSGEFRAVALIAPAVTQEDISLLFNTFDVAGDGVLDRNDLYSLFKKLDKDKDGGVSLNELMLMADWLFEQAMYQQVFAMLNTDNDTYLDKNELSAFLNFLDTNGDNFVSLEEFKVVAQHIAPGGCSCTDQALTWFFTTYGGGDGLISNLNSLFNTLDKDQDDRVSFDDISRALMSSR